MKKKSKEFKRNKIKLIKLKNRKKENLIFQKIGKEFKEKLRGIWLVQNYSKTNFGTVFKNNEVLRKIF